MPELEPIAFSKMTPKERAEAIVQAASALSRNECVVLPTDTLYGLVTSTAAADLLDSVTGYPEVHDTPRMTLHLADADVLLEHLVFQSRTARRLIGRLLPGPTRMVIEQPERSIQDLLNKMGVERGLVDNGTHIAVRIPDHPVFRDVVRQSGVACVARRLGSALWAIGNNPGTDTSPVPERFSDSQSHKPAIVLDDGQTLHRQHSTTVSISSDGRIEVGESGVLSERDVLSNLERTVLFVCTGNTCRSPMAEAIARDLLSRQPPSGITTTIESAGVAAGDGMPMSSEAVQALGAVQITGSQHQSRALTLEMIDRAEVIYTMTPTHAQCVMTMAPNSVHKVFVLDEQESVPDPFGQDLTVYQHTAERLRTLITRRLKEIST